ncbi:MAG: DNA-3-methyladenine glycosylase I [Phycisphaerales bacterium]
MTPKSESRCKWAKSESEIFYHDQEWGVPNRDEHHLFEMLTLEGAQAGLSWSTILNKREGYRKLFKKFDPKKVAKFTQNDIEQLMLDPSIVRNRLKIESTVNNAKAVLELYKQGTTFSELMWSHVDNTPIVNRFASHTDIPAQTDLSKHISKDLKKQGFRFVGPTVIYAMMQACGMVNDHTTNCPQHKACAKLS